MLIYKLYRKSQNPTTHIFDISCNYLYTASSGEALLEMLLLCCVQVSSIVSAYLLFLAFLVTCRGVCSYVCVFLILFLMLLQILPIVLRANRHTPQANLISVLFKAQFSQVPVFVCFPAVYSAFPPRLSLVFLCVPC